MGVELDFEPFVRGHGTELLRIAVLISGSRDRGEELLQETLTYLYPRWDKVAAAETPLAYVRRALVNRLVSERRSPRRNTVALWDLPERTDGRDLGEMVATRRAVWQLVGGLPDRQRAAVVLRYFYDLSDAEIARILDCRAATVRSIISRAMNAMRRGMVPNEVESKAGS